MKKVFAITLMFAMCTLLLQCRKPVFPDVNGTNSNGGYEGVTKNISFKPADDGFDGGDSKATAEFVGNKLKLTWEQGDKLHVFGSINNFTTGQYCGYLTYNVSSESFKGRLDNIPTGENGRLRFYFWGDDMSYDNVNELYEMDFSTQNGNLNGEHGLCDKIVSCTDPLEVMEQYNNIKIYPKICVVIISYMQFKDNADITFSGFKYNKMRVLNNGNISFDGISTGSCTTLEKAGGKCDYYTIIVKDINSENSVSYVFTDNYASKPKTSTLTYNFGIGSTYSGDGKDHGYELGTGPANTVRGVFTVNSSGKKVYFSNGNLQYKGKGKGDNLTPEWKFADNQWDYMAGGPLNTISSNLQGNVDLGSDFSGTSSTYYGSSTTIKQQYYNHNTNTTYTTLSNSDVKQDMRSARDLFGWGATGYQDVTNHENQKYYTPYATATTNEKYGPSDNSSGTYNLVVSKKSDWGYVMGEGSSIWRTLSGDEFKNLTGTGNTANNKFVLGCRDGKAGFKSIDENGEILYLSGLGVLKNPKGDGRNVYGFFILPDYYYYNEENPKHYNNIDVSPTGSWAMTVEELKRYGAVFLPQTCNRTSGSILWVSGDESVFDAVCNYWTSTVSGTTGAQQFLAGVASNQSSIKILSGVGGSRFVGRAVRLVTDY